MKVCEEKLLRKIFEPKRDEVAEDWRRLHNEDLHNVHISYLLSPLCSIFFEKLIVTQFLKQ
jgi:hypothetical protein